AQRPLRAMRWSGVPGADPPQAAPLAARPITACPTGQLAAYDGVAAQANVPSARRLLSEEPAPQVAGVSLRWRSLTPRPPRLSAPLAWSAMFAWSARSAYGTLPIASRGLSTVLPTVT